MQQTWTPVSPGSECNRLFDIIGRHSLWHPLFCAEAAAKMRTELGRAFLNASHGQIEAEVTFYRLASEIEKMARATGLGLDLD